MRQGEKNINLECRESFMKVNKAKLQPENF